MNPESSEDQLDRATSEIRADAAAARVRAPLPERKIVASVRRAENDTGHVTIAELARHAGPTFVDQAFRAILKRGPDPAGLERQMAALASGANKIELLGDLRYSAEGRRAGTPIPGLAPRYFVAKLGRVPLLGALVRWIVALASLPHILRHQRATEASLAVQFGELRAALQAAEQRDAEQREGLAALSIAADALSERSARLEEHARALDATVSDLRGLVLAMNHWTVEVRRSIDAIDAAEAERRAGEDEAAAARIARRRDLDTERRERIAARAAAFAGALPDRARVLDLCGGADWLAALVERGCRVTSIETNSALHRRARERKLDVTFGDPLALLERTSDASLDALTLDAARIGASVPTVLGEAQRILKRGGILLIDLGEGAPPDAAALSAFAARVPLDAGALVFVLP
ncbi:MAG TPA: methyltransferase domain-containing protein [Rhodanobacteraceae bacterium]|nr:methyltransferase domain-containing protein [Rhodanobacteraceae bacterium]